MSRELTTNQMMGYDRSATMFTPDGRIIQVEYAKKSVRYGSVAIGIACSDGVLVVVDKRNKQQLLVIDFTEKIMQVDDHIGVALAGMIGDGRILIEKSQLKAQTHMITFDTPIDVKSVASYIAEEKQLCTQIGGLRPFGVSIIIAGVDDKPRLFLTEPMGTFYEYKAVVIGEGEEEIKKTLAKSITKRMPIEKGLRLCISLIRKSVGKEFTNDRISGFYIKTDTRMYTKISKKEINNASKETSKHIRQNKRI